ncbi:MAG: hypothetical protein ABIO84_02040 [Lysobacter sp.]
MKIHPKLLAAACLITLCSAAWAQSFNPAHGGPANRIVGLWHVTATIGACAGGPKQTFLALANYHAGGTMSDANTMPPASRGPGVGIWSFQGKGQFNSRFQFFRYLPNGSYDGLQDINGSLSLDTAGMHYVQTIHAQALNADGSVRVELCGSATGDRVSLPGRMTH